MMNSVYVNKFKRLIGLAVICLAFLTWCFSTIAYKGYAFSVCGFVSAMLALILYIFCHCPSFWGYNNEFSKELCNLDIVLLLIGLILSTGTISRAFSATESDKVIITYLQGVSIDVAELLVGIEILIWVIAILIYQIRFRIITKAAIAELFITIEKYKED